MIGEEIGISQDAACTYALFHDAAIPLMMKRFKDYGRVMEAAKCSGQMLVDAGNIDFPCAYPVVGSLMVRSWGLPQILGVAIRFHHEPDAHDFPDCTLLAGALSLIAVTHIAEHLSAEVLGETDLEVGAELYERALAFVGLSENELDQIPQRVLVALDDA